MGAAQSTDALVTPIVRFVFVAQSAVPGTQMTTVGDVVHLVDVVTGSAATLTPSDGGWQVREARPGAAVGAHRACLGLAADGRLAHWRPETGLDRAFPLGGHLTHRLLYGDPRKVVLVRSGTAVTSGNHRAPGHKPDPDTLACVYHFTWRSGVLDDLRRRVERFTADVWSEASPAVRDEASRLLQHIARHHGRIDVADPRLAFRHVALDRLPDGWTAKARQVATRWRPPATAKGAR